MLMDISQEGYINIFTDIMDLKNDGGYLTGRVERITTSSLLMLS